MDPKSILFLNTPLLWLPILHLIILISRKLLNTLQVKDVLYKKLNPYLINYLVKRKIKILWDFSEAKRVISSLFLNISKLPRITEMYLHVLGMPSLFYSLQYFISLDIWKIWVQMHSTQCKPTSHLQPLSLFTWLLQCFQREKELS